LAGYVFIYNYNKRIYIFDMRYISIYHKVIELYGMIIVTIEQNYIIVQYATDL